MNQKLKDVFKGMVINKVLTTDTGVDEFPRYVGECLIDNHCSEETFHADMEKVERRLRHSPFSIHVRTQEARRSCGDPRRHGTGRQHSSRRCGTARNRGACG